MATTPEATTEETRTPGFCALCKSRCGSVMVTQGGRLLRQEPDPAHPTGKALCVKGKAAPEIVYRASRQLYPLKRTRPKGDADPGWQRISWDEALATVAARLSDVKDTSGAEAVAFGCTTPSGTPIADDLRWIERFTNAFGSPNVSQGTEICNWHKDYAHAYTFGRGVSSPDFAQTGCIVFWGHNPSATWLDHAMAGGAAVARGARLVVVDPRRAGMASKADQWLRVRPGADNALALGIGREMLAQGWYDRAFVTRWTNGPLLVRGDNGRFLRARDLASPPAGIDADDLLALREGSINDEPRWASCAPSRRSEPLPDDAALFGAIDVLLADGRTIRCSSAFGLYRDLCEPWTHQRVTDVAWVDGAQIAATARLLHESGPVCYYLWSGVGQHTNATQTDRAIAILMALTGSVDAPGGNVVFGKPPSNNVSGNELLDDAQRAKCIELTRSTLGPGADGWVGSDALAASILDGRPYRVRAMMNFGRNFLVTHAHGSRVAEALRSLEFFVHADVVMNPTAELADIFLPINTPWERDALRVGFEGSAEAESLVQLRQAVIESRGESRSDAQVVFDLALRLGLGDVFWNGDIEAGLNHVLQPAGLTVDALRAVPGGVRLDTKTDFFAYQRRGFKTATGKIEVYSERFLDEGQPPLPVFVEPALSPMTSAARNYPLVLTSAKVVQFCHGQHRDIPSLRRRSPEPELSLAPEAAEARGIDDGDKVRLDTPMGSATFRAKVDRSLDARVVCAQYGWWQANAELSLPSYAALGDDGASMNRLVDDGETDPVSGSVGLRSSLCEVRLATAAARTSEVPSP